MSTMQVSGRKGRGDVERSSNESGNDLYCVPCQRDDENNEAFGYCQECTEHLCETCYKSHRKAKLNIGHVLLDKQCMPTSMSEQTKLVTMDCRVPCTKTQIRQLSSFVQTMTRYFVMFVQH